MNVKTKRPEYVTNEHLEYLDELRESGVTNMYGASVYVERLFEIESKEAKNILMYWMQSFGNDDR